MYERRQTLASQQHAVVNCIHTLHVQAKPMSTTILKPSRPRDASCLSMVSVERVKFSLVVIEIRSTMIEFA